MLNEEILQYIQNHREEAYELLLTLARIPAPSNHEEKRARFCSEWLKAQGAEGVYVDEALNVVYPVEAGDHVPVEVYMAHTDVVFPDEEELPLRVEEGRIYCPGVGDDTEPLKHGMPGKSPAGRKVYCRPCGQLWMEGTEGAGCPGTGAGMQLRRRGTGQSEGGKEDLPGLWQQDGFLLHL